MSVAQSRRKRTEKELRDAEDAIAVIEGFQHQHVGNSSESRMLDNLELQQRGKAEKRRQELAGADAFAARLRHLREERGLTQAELAKSAGVGQAMISLLEKGDRQPNWTTVCRLAEVLGVGVEAFRQGV